MIDLARYLVGEVEAVSGGTRTFKEGRDVDDAFEAVVEFENGAIGTVEASRFCPGSQERLHVGDQRLQGLHCLRPRAPERASGQPPRLEAG